VIVVDTNVIAYLWIPGAATESAERLFREDPEWCAPLLWRSELRNVLAAQLRRKRVTLDIALRIVESAQEHLHGREFEVASERVLQAVSESRCSAYDCEFVALARELALPLVSNDRQILRDFPDVAVPLVRA
jgi:predicted nucleic acid-binding protein